MNRYNMVTRLAFCALLGLSTGSLAAINRDQAEESVKQLVCKDSTVDITLNHLVRSSSQRDIGWQVFEESDYFDVQRSILVSKGMELRYRWRVFQDGRIQAENERAQQLCQRDDE